MFYKLINSSNLKEIGSNPQIDFSISNAEIFTGHKGQYEPISIKNIVSPQLVLFKKARLTDSMSGFSDDIRKIFSIRFYDFLKSYLDEHKVWDLEISNNVYRFNIKKSKYIIDDDKKIRLYAYKVLHISYPCNNFLHFDRSIFFVDFKENYRRILIENNGIPKSYINNEEHKEIKVDSIEMYNDFLKKENEKESIVLAKKLVFKKDIDAEMFRIFTPLNNFSGYYVSKTLKDIIQEKGYTGMDFIPLTEINPNIEIEII